MPVRIQRVEWRRDIGKCDVSKKAVATASSIVNFPLFASDKMKGRGPVVPSPDSLLSVRSDLQGNSKSAFFSLGRKAFLPLFVALILRSCSRLLVASSIQTLFQFSSRMLYARPTRLCVATTTKQYRAQETAFPLSFCASPGVRSSGGQRVGVRLPQLSYQRFPSRLDFLFRFLSTGGYLPRGRLNF
uniref:Uncharacterized protein n=1 Tax=Toxoplasma gondii (strain ATCC 50861 / VEG) TaxID=432359 RepID=A0A0F7V5W9_TOXGV|nr:TPA: hypothetical protein BN1205_065020 [Toxoplasma gondii VEG]